MEKKEQGPKKSYIQRFKELNHDHPVMMNIVYIILTAILLVWLLLYFIDVWTLHGKEVAVPSVKGQNVELAEITLGAEQFQCEVMDSVFESAQRPGTVVEQNPHPGALVKPGRTVYLTIVAYSPKMVTIPDFKNVSRRQAYSMFEGIGLKVHAVTVPSEYKDLVIDASYKGSPMYPGQRIPIGSTVTVEIGGGMAEDSVEEAIITDLEEYSEGGDEESETLQLLLE